MKDGLDGRPSASRKGASSASLPRLSTGWGETPKYFTAGDAQTIAKEVGLDLVHDDGGRHAAKLMQRQALCFAHHRLLGRDPHPEEFVDWATQVIKHSAALARLLNFPVDEGCGADPSLDTLRSWIEADQKDKSRLAQSARILIRSSQHLGGYDGDPFPITRLGISYLHEFSTAVRDRYGSPARQRRTKGSTVGVDELIRGLEDTFVSIFGKKAGVSTIKKTGRRGGPAVRFMRAFANALAGQIDLAQPDEARRLKLWGNSNNDALAELLIKNQKAQGRRRGGK